MKNELITGAIGTTLSAVGTSIQTNEILETISIIITIIGAIITFIVMPILNWYKSAKADGKITKDEIKEGVNTLSEGINQVIDASKNNKEKEDKNDCNK